MVGWEGCMAEDSHSFAKAFQVVNFNLKYQFLNNKIEVLSHKPVVSYYYSVVGYY